METIGSIGNYSGFLVRGVRGFWVLARGSRLRAALDSTLRPSPAIEIFTTLC